MYLRRALNLGSITTYPRKGTETNTFLVVLPMENITTYPRKGTVTEKRFLLIIDIVITTYPRKGTVTLSVSSEEQVSENYNLSLQNPLRRCAPALPKGELFRLPLPCTKLPLSGELARRKP